MTPPREARARPLRVFIGLTEVAGYFGGLESGLRSQGVDAYFLDESHHAFGYRRPGIFAKVARACRAMLQRSEASSTRAGATLWWVGSLPFRGLKALLRAGLFLSAIVRYDAFIFGGGDSLLPRNADLPILNRLGKRVVWVFTGSDHRPAYLNGPTVRELRDGDVDALTLEAKRVKERVRTAERFADCIVAWPPSGQFHSRPFVNVLPLGIPFRAPTEMPRYPDPFRGAGVKVLHAPSDPISKGSGIIRACIDDLKSSGHAIDYIEMTGRPHAEILSALQACDFLIDELFSDAPMAVLATEAAFFGKPTVVAGYYADQMIRDLPPEWIPPSAFVAPDRLRPAVERLIADGTYRRELGEAACTYVRERGAPGAVAKRFVRLIEGDVPAEWVVDPKAVRYLHGYGLPEEAVREAIRSLVDAFGASGLLVDHNPALREAFIRFAGLQPPEAPFPES